MLFRRPQAIFSSLNFYMVPLTSEILASMIDIIALRLSKGTTCAVWYLRLFCVFARGDHPLLMLVHCRKEVGGAVWKDDGVRQNQ